MPRLKTDNIALHYEQFGARANPMVILVHGLTCQSIHWPRPLVGRLTAAGYRVVVFDNRDAGLSTHLDHLRVGTIEEVMAHPRATEAPYDLGDMAVDAIALMNHLGQSGAHIIGFSMGGMIAQRLALDFPERVFSITSIASSTSDPDLPGGDRTAFDAFVSTPPDNRAAAIAHIANGWRLLGGSHFDSIRMGLGRLAEQAYDRGYTASGAARQLLAILHASPRGEALGDVQQPALVIHGREDPLVPLAAGERTAACLPRSRLVIFDELGHDLPEPLLADFGDAIVAHLDGVPEQR